MKLQHLIILIACFSFSPYTYSSCNQDFWRDSVPNWWDYVTCQFGDFDLKNPTTRQIEATLLGRKTVLSVLKKSPQAQTLSRVTYTHDYICKANFIYCLKTRIIFKNNEGTVIGSDLVESSIFCSNYRAPSTDYMTTNEAIHLTDMNITKNIKTIDINHVDGFRGACRAR
jgi:hypothetical protein